MAPENLLMAADLSLSRDGIQKPAMGMSLLVLLGVFLLFHFQGVNVDPRRFGTSLFTWLWEVWNDRIFDTEHGRLIPLIFLGLIWHRRREFAGQPWVVDVRGLGAVILSLGIHWVGMKAQQPRLSAAAFILLLWGMVWYLHGWQRARTVRFAFIFLIFMIPMNFLEAVLAFPLRLLVTQISVGLAHGLGIPVLREGTRLFNADIPYEYDVAPACSGIRSLMAIFMISLLYGYVTQSRRWKKGVLFLSAIPLAIAGNVARVACIILAAQCFGSKAGDFVHEWFGFLIFGVVFLLLALLDRKILGRWKDPVSGKGEAS